MSNTPGVPDSASNAAMHLGKEHGSRPGIFRSMKRIGRSTVLLGMLMAGLVCGSGCSRHYRITMSGGGIMDTRGKPKLDSTGRAYHFKDADGRDQTIPAFRVREIAPR